MAAITDKFNKAANGTGTYPSIASVTSARAKDGSILSCDDLTGWATDTPVHFSTYRILPDGTVDTSTQSDWKGIVSGNSITQMTWLAGNKDAGHLVGDKIELNPTIGWLDDLITGILKSHNQDGSLKDSIVQSKNIASSAITSAKIANGAVSSGKIANNAITSANVNWGSLAAYRNHGTRDSVGSTEVILDTYTIPNDGKYTIDFEGSTAITGATKHILSIVLYLDGERVWGQDLASIANYAGNNSVSLVESFTGTMSKGSKLTLRAKVSNSTTKVTWTLNLNQIW